MFISFVPRLRSCCAFVCAVRSFGSEINFLTKFVLCLRLCCAFVAFTHISTRPVLRLRRFISFSSSERRTNTLRPTCAHSMPKRLRHTRQAVRFMPNMSQASSVVSHLSSGSSRFQASQASRACASTHQQAPPHKWPPSAPTPKRRDQMSILPYPYQ